MDSFRQSNNQGANSPYSKWADDRFVTKVPHFWSHWWVGDPPGALTHSFSKRGHGQSPLVHHYMVPESVRYPRPGESWVTHHSLHTIPQHTSPDTKGTINITPFDWQCSFQISWSIFTSLSTILVQLTPLTKGKTAVRQRVRRSPILTAHRKGGRTFWL